MRILVLGNCQAPGLARCLAVMLPEHEVIGAAQAQLGLARRDMARFDVVVAQPYPPVAAVLAETRPARVIRVPRIVFKGFHPDMGFLLVGRQPIRSPTGEFHSRIALWAHMRGLDAAATAALFSEHGFATLGYGDAWGEAWAGLAAEGRETGLPLDDLMPRWRQRGCFMYGVVQPHLFVLADLARSVVDRLQCTPAVAEPEAFLHDELKDEAVWGVYPPLAERLGVPGGYAFKAPGPGRPKIMGLEEFLEASFAVYAGLHPEQMTCPGLDLAVYDRLLEAPPPTKAQPPAASSATSAADHPYRALPPERFWRRAVAQADPLALDPVPAPPFRIEAGDRVATAGSCFAQHLAQGLAAAGLTHHVVEPTDDGVFPAYSARYGNIYTARQLVQLFDRAHDRFTPTEPAWPREDGVWVDPFRQPAGAGGWPCAAAVAEARTAHLAAVRRLFAELDVFVFTLGLTEAWLALEDGAVFPIAPGVLGGGFDPTRHAFHNFTAAEVTADLEGFVARLGEVNPGARVILTVSPVPLAATASDDHVLVASTYSKAVLRTAAAETAARHGHVAYFPAFELVTGPHLRGRGFAADLRSVAPLVVRRVLDLFLRHYAPAAKPGADPAFDWICEEAALDPEA